MRIEVGRKYINRLPTPDDWVFEVTRVENEEVYYFGIHPDTPTWENVVAKQEFETLVKPKWIEVSNTRLARKLYPSAVVDENGMLVIEC